MEAYLLAVINDNAEEDYYGTPLSTVQLSMSPVEGIRLTLCTFTDSTSTMTDANNQVMDERPFSQQIVFGDTPFQIQSSMLHGCTVVC